MDRREAMKLLATGACGTVAVASVRGKGEESPVNTETEPGQSSAAQAHRPIDKGGVQFWLSTSMHRVYPTSTADESAGFAGTPLVLKSGRNYRLSFQACFRNIETSSARMQCQLSGISDIDATVRRVGFVPMKQLNTFTPSIEQEGIGKIPGLCPDPLFPEQEAEIGPYATGVFWVSLVVPETARVGRHQGKITFTMINRFAHMEFENPEKFTVDLPFEVEVVDVVVARRKNFPVTFWTSADSIWEYYKISPDDDRFWSIAEAFIKNLAEHGVDVVYTPIFNIRAEKLKRPAQLLKVKRTGNHEYEFDFSDVRRWIKLAKKYDANHVEFSHFFSPAPNSAQFPQKVYERTGDKFGDLLWPADTPATSDTYRRFLKQFLPQFKAMLEEEGMLDKALFHLADEPDGEAAIKRYRAAREMLRELAPWIRVMDAMSDPHFATERLSDMPVPSIMTATQFTAAGCPAWVYYCCGPRGAFLQRLLDTPLWKIRMHGWLFYHLKAMGFLHWGLNYWFKFCTDQIDDPFQDATNGAWPGMPYGDTFVLYPGTDGPLDSIRWEIFAESMQDYALLQTAGISRDDAMLRELKNYNDFPKEPGWVVAALETALAKATENS